MRATIPQLAITAVAAAFAGLALLSGLDRLAAGDSTKPAVIRWPYARNAPFNAAMTAASRHRSDQSTTLMGLALVADPVNEIVIGGLGQVRLFAGDAMGADAAFRTSAQRGWRDRATHFYWMTQSIDAADFKTAALHADALLHAPLTVPERDQVFNMLLEYDEGRNALAARLRSHPQWSPGFALDLDHASVDELAAHADVIARTGPGVWSCQDTAGLVDQLIVAGDTRDALKAHGATCAQSAAQVESGNALNDTRFIRYLAEARASQLDWFSPESADVAISPATKVPNRGGVQITSASGVTGQVMTQHVVIAPGSYTLSWQMPNTDPSAIASLMAELGCNDDLAKSVVGTAVPGKPGAFTAEFRFAGACPAPAVSFWLRPTDKTVTIDTVALKRTGN